jgi:cell division protein FtsN
MTNIEKYISELVGNHDCVIVPGLGAFIAQATSADIHPITHKFTAPGRTLGFNAQIKVNDGLLAAEISRNENVSFQEATNTIEEFVKTFNSTLALYKHYNLSEIGRFFYNVEGKLEFEPDYRVNFSSDSFGLTDFTFKPIERNTFDMNQPTKHRTAKDQTSKEEPSTVGEKKKTTTFAKVLFVLMPLLVLVGAAGFVRYSQNQDISMGGVNIFESLGLKKEAVTVTDTAATAEVLVKDTLTYTTEETPVEALAQTEEVPVMEEVVVETKTTANTSAKKVQNIAPGEVVSGTFYVIIGSFKNESNADKLYSKLTDSGKQVVKLPVDANGFYKVAVGSFESLEKANSEMANLEPSYSGIWVKKY